MSVAAWNRKAFAAEVAAFLAAHPDVEAVDAFVVDVNGHALGKRVPVTYRVLGKDGAVLAEGTMTYG